ncbi:MAG: GHMP kinase [Armatimonadota bacterium]|nr:GHMP kinase [Armatimonadota bacterium]
MQRIEAVAYARAGLVGNPSDGYFGKTISFTMRNFAARVVLYDWPTLEILPGETDLVRFDSLGALAETVRRNGYYGALRLVTAALKKFHDYCAEHKIELPRRNFSIRYETDIPRQVGLAGSSAIITATFRALMGFYGIVIPQEILPNWVLATERDELGITAGLQDRVAQTYEGLVYMDFSREKLERDGYGTYQKLDPSLLPPLYLAYKVELSEISGVSHNNLRECWERGDPEVHAAMREFAALTDRARACLLAGRHDELAQIIDANFDLRCKIMNVNRAHLQMVKIARACGASAHFPGSGGAILGTYPNLEVYARLQDELTKIGCRVIVPKVVG